MTDAPRPTLILNVDDNDGARYAKTRILIRAGFAAMEAATGAEALAKVREHAPDLVLLDVKLPDISGLEVCRLIKTSAETATTLVLQTSAAAVHSMDKVRALDGGADNYLTEPIEPAELIANVRALLRLRQAEDAWRRSERALRESEERFRQLAENIDDVFWMLDPQDNRMLYVSPAYRTLWGRDPAGVAPGARHWSEGVHPDDAGQVAQAWQALAHDVRYEQEYRVARPDGSMRWVRERVFPVRDDAGRARRLAGIVTDVSERKTAELLLRDADRRKDQFLAMLAHELRNPLAPIRNAVEIMHPDRQPGVRAIDAAREIISRQVNHLARLVDDLLDVSRITQGKVTLKQEIVQLDMATSAAVETARSLIDAKRHTLEVRLPPRSPIVLGDPVRIAQVIGNLLSNAAKYTPEGGHIVLSVAGEQGQVAVMIEDNGIGISAEMLPHIFELFVQSENSLERSEGGLGIGLPLARTLIQMHGGTIDAHSGGLGHGSRFTARLPALDIGAQAQPAAQPQPDMSASARPKRVLLVDDSVDAAAAMSLLLESLGHDVRVAHDGLAGLAATAAFQPEVVILDIGLPGMDGYAVAREMRRRPETAGAMLFALTGYGQPGDREQSREAGFDRHFVKPVSFVEIEAAINDALPARADEA
jgi:PAS domain S-box-containing protein